MASLNGIRSWDEQADVVIVGFGLAGAVSAIEAIETDPSADVLIIEKMPARLAGGNSRASGQSLFTPHDVEKLLLHQRALNQPNPVPESLLRVWAEAMCSQETWIQGMAAAAAGSTYQGGKNFAGSYVEFPEMPGSEVAGSQATIQPNPSGVWNAFKVNVESRRIRIRYETPAIDLVQDPDTLEIFGVVAKSADKHIAIRARRAVIMCCGGYENNLDMQRNYHGTDEIYFYGTPGNTGDGIKMLQKAGADLWHLKNKTQSSGFWPGFKVPDYQTPFLRYTKMQGTHFIELAKDGRRFHNETYNYRERHHKMPSHGHWLDSPQSYLMPVHMVFNQKMLDSGCLISKNMSWNGCVEKFPWSDDNRSALEKGWITQAGSVEELASKLGCDPRAYRDALDRYNGFCDAGTDQDFGRSNQSLHRIDGGPFYGIKLSIGIICTTGGGRRNERAQVLDQQGNPIPRLYEAGELGSIISNLYQSGSFLTECMVFGRIAGRMAIAEKPWANT